MKKRTMAFGGLAMAVAITAYSVGGTYAKYTSAIDLVEEARVAKWDITAVNTDGTVAQTLNLFANSYSVNDKGVYVKSIDGDKVVAPGTKGEYQVNLAGDMEVRYMFDIDFEGADLTVPYYLDGDNNFTSYGEYQFGPTAEGSTSWEMKEPTGEYHPIVYTITLFNGYKREEYFKYTGSLTEIQEKLDEYSKSAEGKAGFAPGQLGLSLRIEWQWNAENDVDGLSRDQVDKLDTWLGQNYNWNEDFNNLHDYATDEYKLTITATQVAEDHATKTA